MFPIGDIELTTLKGETIKKDLSKPKPHEKSVAQIANHSFSDNSRKDLRTDDDTPILVIGRPRLYPGYLGRFGSIGW